jgi:hypothetical protein
MICVPFLTDWEQQTTSFLPAKKAGKTSLAKANVEDPHRSLRATAGAAPLPTRRTLLPAVDLRLTVSGGEGAGMQNRREGITVALALIQNPDQDPDQDRGIEAQTRREEGNDPVPTRAAQDRGPTQDHAHAHRRRIDRVQEESKRGGDRDQRRTIAAHAHVRVRARHHHHAPSRAEAGQGLLRYARVLREHRLVRVHAPGRDQCRRLSFVGRLVRGEAERAY